MTDREQYRVTLSVPWLVRGAGSPQDAIDIAVSEAGRRVNETETPSVSECDISVQTLPSADCGETEAVLIVAETALVGLTLDCTVTAASPQDAERTARRELGDGFEGIPLLPVGTTSKISEPDPDESS